MSIEKIEKKISKINSENEGEEKDKTDINEKLHEINTLMEKLIKGSEIIARFIFK